MKDFLVGWTDRGRKVLAVALLVLGWSAGTAWAAKNALVEVGFIGVPPPGFQNVLLNVRAVRINRHAFAGPGTGGWQLIPTPPGIGGGNQNAEVQIDLNLSQDMPQLFNTAGVQPNKYLTAEILLDTNNPGTLIPNCPQSPGGPEGCINYPIALNPNEGQLITTQITGISPKSKTLTPMILRIQVMINQAPTVAGGAYVVTLTTSQSTAGLGTITGPITTSGSSSGTTGNKTAKLAVTAETIGTNTAISSAFINKSNNTYTLILPAAPNFGTLYDLAVAGGGDSYAAARLPPLFSSSTINGPAFKVAGQPVGNITGTVTSACTPPNTPIVGATLQLLIPPGDETSPNTAIDCTNPAMAPECITVATANTDSSGGFPLPGSLTVSPQFQNVPMAPKANTNSAYAMEVTAPGYDPLFVQVKPTAGAGQNAGGMCAPPGSKTFTKCNLSMTTRTITGTIPITPPLPGQTVTVDVFAEPSGTNDIQSSLANPISVRNPNTSFMYTLKVPTKIATFDLFATTIDQFQGVVDPYQGHSIVVLSGVTPTGTACASTTADFDPSVPIDCVGHGSVIGQANVANLGASIVLSKVDPMSGSAVQITTSPILNQSTVSPTSNYGFCAPGGTYELQPLQLPQPVADETPLAAPSPALAGSPVTVTIPQAPLINGASPVATPTPKVRCPTTCSNPDGSCPGTCNTVIQPINIPAPPAAADAAPTP